MEKKLENNERIDLPGSQDTQSEDQNAKLIEGDENNYSIGTKDAKLHIVEFADFACPYCKQSFSKIREISLNNIDKVRYTYRDLPIIKSYSIDLSLAARCAGEQGLFWQMHDKLFMEQGLSSIDELTLLAKRIGADTTRFRVCMDTNKYETQIKKDLSDAEALGLVNVGTPVWFFNGKMVSGDIPEETFLKIVEDYLQ